MHDFPRHSPNHERRIGQDLPRTLHDSSRDSLDNAPKHSLIIHPDLESTLRDFPKHSARQLSKIVPRNIQNFTMTFCDSPKQYPRASSQELAELPQGSAPLPAAVAEKSAPHLAKAPSWGLRDVTKQCHWTQCVARSKTHVKNERFASTKRTNSKTRAFRLDETHIF